MTNTSIVQLGLFNAAALVAVQRPVFKHDPITSKGVAVGNRISLRKDKDIAADMGLSNSKENKPAILAHKEEQKAELLRHIKLVVSQMEAGKFEGQNYAERQLTNGRKAFKFEIRDVAKRSKFTDEETVDMLNSYTGGGWTVEKLRESRAAQEKSINVAASVQNDAGLTDAGDVSKADAEYLASLSPEERAELEAK